MSGTIKNCYSPKGMGFWVNRSFRYEKDCPACKYGTLDRIEARNSRGVLTWAGWKCIDCGHKIEEKIK